MNHLYLIITNDIISSVFNISIPFYMHTSTCICCISWPICIFWPNTKPKPSKWRCEMYNVTIIVTVTLTRYLFVVTHSRTSFIHPFIVGRGALPINSILNTVAIKINIISIIFIIRFGFAEKLTCGNNSLHIHELGFKYWQWLKTTKLTNSKFFIPCTFRNIM